MRLDQSLGGVDGVGRPVAIDLDAAHLERRVVRDGAPDHVVSLLSCSARRIAVRRVTDRHEQHAIQHERIARLFTLTGLDEYFTFVPG